jgi:pilus assembly protein CpaB
MGRRTILLIAAVIVAALGTALIFVYVNGVNDRAVADQQPQVVLFAKSTIPAGTSAKDAAASGALVQKKIAKDSVAVGALSDITPIDNQVALAPVYQGQQIVSQMFGAQGTTSSLPIPGNDLAMSVQLNDPARVAGFVEPGSNVAIFITLPPQAGGTNKLQTKLLLPKTQVIAVGPTTTTSQTSTNSQTGQTNTEQISRAILTLAVTQKEAEQIIFGQGQGQLYFGLLTSNSRVSPSAGVSAQNLFG